MYIYTYAPLEQPNISGELNNTTTTGAKRTVIKSTTICVEMLQKFESVYKYIESTTPQVFHHESVYKNILYSYWWNETVIFFYLPTFEVTLF